MCTVQSKLWCLARHKGRPLRSLDPPLFHVNYRVNFGLKKAVLPASEYCMVLRGVYSDTTQLDVELCRYRRVSIATQLNSIDPVEQRTAKSVVFLFMTSRSTYKLSQLGHYVHSIGDSWVELCRYRHFANSTQLDVELSWVELRRCKRAFRLFCVATFWILTVIRWTVIKLC